MRLRLLLESRVLTFAGKNYTEISSIHYISALTGVIVYIYRPHGFPTGERKRMTEEQEHKLKTKLTKPLIGTKMSEQLPNEITKPLYN